MCIFKPFTDELHSCSYTRQSTVFDAVLYSFIHKSVAVRFFKSAVNSAGGEKQRREGETGDIIVLNES